MTESQDAIDKKTAKELKELMESIDTQHQKEMIISLGEFSKKKNKEGAK